MPAKSKSTRAAFIFGIVIIGLALFVAAPLVIKQNALAVGTQAFSNARSFGFALREFENEYGSFPNDSTTAEIKARYETDFDLSGNSSNAAFRQLIAAKVTQSEQMFYAEIVGTRKPDGNISPSEALKKGEVGFAYISGLSTKDDPSTPLAVSPIIPKTTRFEQRRFAGIACVLQVDGTVRSYPIRKDGRIYRDGIDLLSPKHPIWKGKAPDIRYPDL